MLGWLFRKATAGVIESAGEAVTKVIRVTKGDKAQVEAAVHDEQMAVLAEHAAEFVARPDRTYLDSIVDFLNRLPRVIITFWVFMIFTWPAIDADGFMIYILSLELIPDELWQFAMIVVGLYFGGRVISQDIRRPRLSAEQKEKALEVIREREKAIIEARTPLVVEVAPTRKPPLPAWAIERPADVPIIPPIKVEPDTQPTKGRPVKVDRMIEALIEREGGYVNDPADSGGATNYGITQQTLSAWRQKECTVDDVKALTPAEAAEIYRTHYYFAPGIDSLPAAIQAHVMDIGVNCGPRTGVKMLQQALNRLGAGVKEDGIVGPMTRDACNAYDLARINNELVDVRIKFYEQLASRRPKDRKFLSGWKKRAKSFLVA